MPDQRAGRGLALWLLPEKTHQDRLAAACHALRGRLGGPRVVPHVTLLGALSDTPETLSHLTHLGAALAPLSLSIRGPGSGDRWFHCIFLDIEPSPGLDRALDAASRRLGAPPRPVAPHISLLYGELSPTVRAQTLADLPPLPSTVPFTALALVDVRGPAEVWRERARILLR